MTALLTDNLPLLTDAPNGIKKLRELILELAVRGKLVPQDPSDEPASELLKHIAEEKARLVAESKIKKSKALAKITEEEIPFFIPTHWEWVRLDSLLKKIGAGSTPLGGKQAYVTGGVKFLRSQNVWNEGLRLNDVAFIPEETHKKMSGTHVEAGDLLFNITGASIGRCAAVPSDFDTGNVSQHVTIIRPVSIEIQPFLHIVLVSQLVQQTVMDMQVGVSREGLSIGKLSQFLIPFPPEAEQHRIVAKVDELMALCDRLEAQQTDAESAHARLVQALFDSLTQASDATDFIANWQRLAEHFHTLLTTEPSIDALKQTLLQLAVMGKLVPQAPSDESADKLLKRISDHRSTYREKKQKSLADISEVEKPFKLPYQWAWTTLPAIGELARGKSRHRPRNDPSLYAGGNVPLIQTGDVARANGIVKTHSAMYNAKGVEQSRLWPAGTMCITIAANIADSATLGFDACFPDSVVGFIPEFPELDVRYFEFFLRTAKSHLEDFAPSTAQKNINLEILGLLSVPLPPANEIRRIVAKVDQLMALCDQLKTRLNQARQLNEQLASTLVEQAVA